MKQEFDLLLTATCLSFAVGEDRAPAADIFKAIRDGDVAAVRAGAENASNHRLQDGTRKICTGDLQTDTQLSSLQ